MVIKTGIDFTNSWRALEPDYSISVTIQVGFPDEKHRKNPNDFVNEDNYKRAWFEIKFKNDALVNLSKKDFYDYLRSNGFIRYNSYKKEKPFCFLISMGSLFIKNEENEELINNSINYSLDDLIRWFEIKGVFISPYVYKMANDVRSWFNEQTKS